MEIQQVQSNLNFDAKQRFLTEAQRKNIRTLIDKMSTDLKYESDGVFFELSAINRLNLGDKASFVGARLSKEKEPLFDKIHFTVDKTELVIDSKSGKIEDYHKPFFTRWTKVMQDIDKHLKLFMENFDNPQIVQKEQIKFSGMTKEAFDVFKRELDKLYKNRKEKK